MQIEYHSPVRLVGHAGTFSGFDVAAYACPDAVILADTNTSLLKLRKAFELA